MSISIDIDAPVDQVWPYLVDWDNLGRWMKEGSSFKVTSGHREGVGVEAEAEIKIAGVKTRDKIRVSRWEAPHILQIDHIGWVKGTGLMQCFELNGGTHLFWREILIPPLGVVGAIGIRFFRGLMRRTFERDLKLLKALVESERT